MKRYAQGLLVVALGLSLASTAVAFTGSYVPGAGINGTVHDLGTSHNGMNYTNPADTLNRICIFCHAPHNTYKLSPANGGPGAGVGSGPQAPDAFDYLPLWNHELTSNYASYTMYQNGPGARISLARHHGEAAADLDATHHRIEAILAPCLGRTLLVFHPAYGYFARRYGLEQAAVIESFPGREPSPADVAHVVEVAKRIGARAVFAEPQFSSKAAEVIARESGARVLFLDPLGSTLERGGYVELMRHDVAQMASVMD